MDVENELSFEDEFDALADEAPSGVQDDELEQETLDLNEGADDEQLQEEGQEEEGLREVETPESSFEDKLAKAQADAQLWQHKYNSDLGRQHAFQKKLNEQQNYIQQLENQMRRGEGDKALTPEEWKAVQDDYPDIAAGFKSYMDQREASHKAEMEAIRRELQPIQSQAKENYVQDQFRILEQEHPDYRELAGSNEFKTWVRNQPSNVQDLITSQTASDAAYLLRTYKNEVLPGQQASQELKQRREKQLRQAQTIPSRGGRQRSNLPPEDDFEAAFDFFASR